MAGGDLGQSVRVQIPELQDFLRDLENFSQEVGDPVKVFRKVGDLLRDRARAAAPGSVAGAIQKRTTPQGAGIQIIHTPPRALGVFMGANRRFGWYAAPQFRESKGRQFEKWVGTGWNPGDDVGKPYYIGDAINQSVDDALELMADEIMKMARKAFPESGGASSIIR